MKKFVVDYEYFIHHLLPYTRQRVYKNRGEDERGRWLRHEAILSDFEVDLTLEASVLIKGRRAPFCQVLTSFPGVRNYAKVLHAKAVATGHTDYHLCDIIACRG